MSTKEEKMMGFILNTVMLLAIVGSGIMLSRTEELIYLFPMIVLTLTMLSHND